MTPSQKSDSFVELLGRVLEREGVARTHLIEHACASNSHLRNSLEEFLPAGKAPAFDFLDRPPHALLAPRLRPAAQASLLEDEAPPRHFGPYRLLDLLGEGGMGQVFLAEQEKPLRRRVAVKLLRHRITEEGMRRFEAERQALARLQHPNISAIFDAGSTDSGLPYFVLELIPQAEPVNRYCNRHRLNIERRLRLFIAICRGVEHAHQKQILHRDLKPSNILVTEVDGQPIPKIIDFGLAKSLGGPLAESPAESGPLLVGTPAYISPEVLSRRDSDTRSDVYALGIVLYELLAGRHPFGPAGSPLGELLRRIEHEAPKRPSDLFAGDPEQDRLARLRDECPRDLIKKMRRDLDWVVLKAISKRPEQRYGSASSLINDLEKHLRGEPVDAAPPSWDYRFQKWALRHRRALATALLLFTIACGAFLWHLRVRVQKENLARATEEIVREAERIESMHRLAELQPARDLTPYLVRTQAAMARVHRVLAITGKGVQGPGHFALGQGSLRLGDLDSARDHLQKAWSAGYRSADVALALGTTLGRLFELRLEMVERLPNPLARQKLRAAAERELRDPAVEYLTRARGASLVSPAVISAKIALNRRDYDRALEQSRALIESHPELHEARFLEAEALEHQAALELEESGLEKAEALLDSAEASTLAGLEIARGSAEGHLRLCRLYVNRLSLAARYLDAKTSSWQKKAATACSLTRHIQPGFSVATLSEAEAWIIWAETLVHDHAADPSEALDRVQTLLSSLPESMIRRVAAQRLHARCELTRSSFEERSGANPRKSWDRALTHLERALTLEPSYHFIHSDIAWLLVTRAAYDTHRGLDPREDLNRAEHSARAAVAAYPEHVSSAIALAQIHLRHAGYLQSIDADSSAPLEKAGRAMKLAEDLEPKLPLVASTRSGLELHRARWLAASDRDPSPAVEALLSSTEIVLSHNPEDAFAQLIRGEGFLVRARFLFERGESPIADIEAARRWYRNGHRQVPSLPGPYVEMAEIAWIEARFLLSRGENPAMSVAEAVRLANQALAIDRNRLDAQKILSQAQQLF